MKLDSGAINLLRLAARSTGSDGWAKVSKMVWPLCERLPDDLLEKRPSDDGGHVRLTNDAQVILRYT